MRSRRINVFLVIAAFGLLWNAPCPAAPSDAEINDVLTAAESLFLAMKDRQYPAIWTMVTQKTKDRIVSSTYRELKKAATPIEKNKIEEDFREGNAVARAYWEAYIQVFDPVILLEQSRWSIKMIGAGKTEINIQFKKSARPAVLQLFREQGSWKVGLEETFGTRRLLSFF